MHVSGSKVRVAERSKLLDPGKGQQGLMFALLDSGFVLVFYHLIMPHILPFGVIRSMLCHYMLQVCKLLLVLTAC